MVEGKTLQFYGAYIKNTCYKTLEEIMNVYRSSEGF